MSRLIRNYRSGDRVILSEWTREHGTGERHVSLEEMQRRTLEQSQRETDAVRQQAADLLAEAERQAAALLAEAQQQITTLQAEAQARGYEEGYKQGIADGQRKGEAALAADAASFQRALADLGMQREAILKNVENEVVTLALAIVEKIVGHIAHTHRPLIAHTVHRALDELAALGPFTLRVHPADRAFLERFWQEAEANGTDPGVEWELVGDPTIERGGCLLLCGPSTVDARLSTQLKAIVEGLQVADYEAGIVESPDEHLENGEH